MITPEPVLVPVSGPGPSGAVVLPGELVLPEPSSGLVLFAHGSGSSRFSARNRAVAASLQSAGLATLLFDLLSAEEEAIDRRSQALRFNIPLLAERVVAAIDWTATRADLAALALGVFGASTGAAAALLAAVARAQRVAAVVSRGGRPDLALADLPRVACPTLLLVGGLDHQVLDLNAQAAARLRAPHRLTVIPGAGHLFEEPGTLEQVAAAARDWFLATLADQRA